MVSSLFPSLTTSSETQDPSDKFPVGFSYPEFISVLTAANPHLIKPLYMTFPGCAGSLCFVSFSLVVASVDYSLVAVHKVLTAGPSFVGFRHAGSVVVAHGLNCLKVCGIFPDQGSTPCLLPLAGRLFTTASLGKPSIQLCWALRKTTYTILSP